MSKIKQLDQYMRENGNIDMIGCEFINREVSWIDFNMRVLKCASKKIHPLNERLKFLAISSSNLDEFISVRFASILDSSAKKEYNAVLEGIKNCVDYQDKIFDKLKKLYLSKGIAICTDISKLSKSDRAKVRDIFNKSIFPVITPINIGTTNEPPNLLSSQTCIAVTIKNGNNAELSIIPIPDNVNKLYNVNNNIICIEDIILFCINKLFINKEILSKGYFKVIKNANIILSHDDSSYIIDRMSDTIRQRTFSQPIFMHTNADMNKRLRNVLCNLFEIDKKHIISDKELIDYSRFMSSKFLSNPKYSYESFEQNVFDDDEEHYSLFSSISEKDILLHHPYDSFVTVTKFLEHAAIDPDVVAIKQCLYRVSSEDSPIINALIKAAKNGKNVTVLIEIKARFDESRNISLIDKLRYAGVNVVLGLEYLKTHCKICVVMRREKDGIKVYSHLGTGNYNDKTANIYTDLSYFTASQKIGRDLLNVFNILSGVSSPDDPLTSVFYSPINLRSKLNKLIDREIEFAKKGKKAGIVLKLNSLSDEDMVKRLYKAAEKGVKIYIICRGVCSIKPKKNIYIKSIVGRFLEHSRIYYFRNNKSPEYYISSADLLTRNLDRRVEVLVGLKDDDIKEKVQYIIDVMKRDERNSFEMKDNGEYKYIGGDFDCHQWFIDNCSETLKVKLPKKKK